MNERSISPVEILPVDDSPTDVERTTLALQQGNIPGRTSIILSVPIPDPSFSQGTTFSLPRIYEAVTEVAAPLVSTALSCGGETLLLVEDEPMVREIASRSLRKVGYHVLEAGSGKEALQIAAEYTHPIHLLITDMMMPGIGGRDVADRLLAVRPHLKVLYISGCMEDAIVPPGVPEQGIAFLPKPFKAIRLTSEVRALLDR